MESNKLTVEEFARKNLGKSFITFNKNHINVPFGVEAMIVGYNHYLNLIICSMTECSGWHHFGMKRKYFSFIVLLIIAIFIWIIMNLLIEIYYDNY